MAKIGETISAEQFNQQYGVGQTISANQFNQTYGIKNQISDSLDGFALIDQKKKENPLTTQIGFGGAVKQDLSSRREDTQKSLEAYSLGKQGLGSTVLQSVGTGAGFLGDIVMRGISSLAPDFIEKPVVKGVEKGIGAVASTEPAQQVIQKLSSWAEQHPEAAKNLEATLNIAALYPGGKGAQLGGKATKVGVELAGDVAGKTAQVLEESALASKNKFAEKLVSPIVTKAVKESQVARTSEKGVGIFKRSVIEPTTQEKNMAKYVAEIPNVKESNTLQQNFNIIRDYNVKEAEALTKKIAENDFIISKKEIISNLNKAAERLSASPTIVGDAEKTANKLIEGAKKFIEQNEGKASGILKARKDYDNWVLSQKPKAFDAASENAFTLANREIRTALNDLLDAKAPNLDVKASLKKQSTLYSALDNIGVKAAEEANTAFGRFLQSVGSVLGTKNKAVQILAATVGIGGLGAASTFAPVAAGVLVPSILIYKGGQLLLKPEVKNALAKVLREIERLSTQKGFIPPQDLDKIKALLKDERGFINLGAEIGDQTVNLKLHPEDAKIMKQYIEAIRNKTDLSKTLDNAVEDLRIAYGIKDVSADKLAQEFDDILFKSEEALKNAKAGVGTKLKVND